MDIEYGYRQMNERKISEEDNMKFQEKWQAFWMAVTFAEAGEWDTATSIYKETQKRPEKRVAERKRPDQRPRQRL
jgi:hypothetical protein